ncbi:uncharacterized protein LOC133181637 [Saccostrea echinata]|uniref:uncharacterized protein LOC133181637 n=1 Tax=Saccostrea echinata TaxID=191078 RepID=UPI002A81D9FC|nr:uncharacterized protein LOC133181637 [Saccostrea echinata]XP_061172168.1 uncharacterized protein LOC133181637 [Saccostrea echinata]
MPTTTSLIRKYVLWTVLQYFIVIHVTEGADILCNGPLGYDVSSLNGSWTFQVSNKNCPAEPSNGYATCNVTLAFCNKIEKIPECNESSSACVQASNYTGNNESKNFSIGGYTQDPFSLTGGLIVATFGPVFLNYSTTCVNLTTVVKFHCNLQSKWTSGSQGPTPIPKSSNIKPEFEKNQKGECTYTINADFEGACINVVPSLPVSGLSAGTVLIIIFFVSISVYCICGCTCNFVRGYKGPELIPHSQFWIDLPVLIADGMIFTFRCCRQEPTAYDSI